jgi:hypothetical protein
MSSPSDWQARLCELMARFPQHGAGADVACLSLADLWGLYRFLARLAEGG